MSSMSEQMLDSAMELTDEVHTTLWAVDRGDLVLGETSREMLSLKIQCAIAYALIATGRNA